MFIVSGRLFLNALSLFIFSNVNQQEPVISEKAQMMQRVKEDVDRLVQE